MKFGGTSVQDARAFARVAEIVASEGANAPVVVTSAMSKVTDALLNAFETAKKGDSSVAFDSLEPHFERHLKVSRELIDEARQKAFRTELDFARRVSRREPDHDRVVCHRTVWPTARSSRPPAGAGVTRLLRPLETP